ncbi:MAG TPA: ATP-binding cassette domain-containing protein [Tissierellales bacterium]|nr:ATP-binding cassette domain-containing protein [Tissierellales bacterium]
MKEIIRLKNLRKIYKMGEEKIIAVDNINFSVEEKDFIFLLGTSGSGKSTLLNLMVGLEEPKS